MRGRKQSQLEKRFRMPGPELSVLSPQSWEQLVELDAQYEELLCRLDDLEKQVSQVLAKYGTGSQQQTQRQDVASGTCDRQQEKSPTDLAAEQPVA